MKKLTISQRIIFLSTILILLSGLITFVSYKGLKDVSSTYQDILEKNTAKRALGQRIFLGFRESRINALLTVVEGTTETSKLRSLSNVDKAVEDVNGLVAAYEKTTLSAREKTLFEAVKRDWNHYLGILEKIKLYHATKSTDKVALYGIVHGECPKAADKLRESLDGLTAFHNENIKIGEDRAAAVSRKSVQVSMTLALFAFLFGSIVSFLTTKFTKNNLDQIVKKISGVTFKLNSTSEDLSNSSQQLAVSAKQQASSTEEISSSVEEITGMVGSTIKQADDSVKLSKEISKLVDSSSESMEILEKSVAEIAESNQKVEKLVYLIEEIGKKTELIDEIVFQTRLLSFNASVEAERAGEHGRGFAVVAQEVGNLAQMSGKSACEISDIVKRSVKEAEEVAQLNRAKVVSGVESSKQASAKLKSIQQVAKDINSAVNEVLRAAEEQNTGIRQINTNVQLISQSTQENAQSAEKFHQGSQELNDQSKALGKSIKELQLMVSGTSSVSSQQEESNFENVIAMPAEKQKVQVKKAPLKKAVGQNFHNEDDDHWESL